MNVFQLRREHAVVLAVLLLHAAALWVLQSGLARRLVEAVTPVALLTEFVTLPAPKTDSPPVPQQAQPVQRREPPPPLPAPQLSATPDPTPAPNAPTGVTTPPPAPPITAPVTANAPPAPPPAPAAPAAPARVELPSSDAAYLQNPKPAYPRQSKTMGEQGQVLLRVLVGLDGKPQQVELRQSSSHERLDQAALQAVMQWRFVPGKRGGVPEAMWVVVPITFELK